MEALILMKKDRMFSTTEAYINLVSTLQFTIPLRCVLTSVFKLGRLFAVWVSTY